MDSSNEKIAFMIFKNAATQIAGQLRLKIPTAQEWVTEFFNKCTEVFNNLGNFYYIFFPDFKSTDSPIGELCIDFIKSYQKSAMCGVTINQSYKLGFIDKNIKADPITITQKVDAYPIALYCAGDCLEIYVKGAIIRRMNFLDPLNEDFGRFSKYSVSCKQYKRAIHVHHKQKLINCMNDYWEDKKKRILKADRNTESIFQEKLFDWLNDNLYDGQVTEEATLPTNDRPDIHISSIATGDQYIIELKWLGKNKAKVTYDDDRILEGVDQIKTYLERGVKFDEACLVCYDGRKTEKGPPADLKLPQKADCLILFLESKSASEKGKEHGV